MKKIKLAAGNNYVCGGAKYVKGKSYTVADSLAKKLLAATNDKDINFFILSVNEELEEDHPEDLPDTDDESNQNDDSGSEVEV